MLKNAYLLAKIGADTAANERFFKQKLTNFRSFSAVSAPIFASKYAFCSIFQILKDYLAEIFEIWKNRADFATFAKLLLNFHENCLFFKPIF